MVRAEITRQGVLNAIAEFDQLGRTAFLKQYGFNKARDYFLVHNRKNYDSKAIAAAAHKWAPGGNGKALPGLFLSGGKDDATKRLIALGFTVTTPGQKADWTLDEHILALELYMANRQSLPAKNSKKIVELSSLLKRLETQTGAAMTAKYRNANGVYMKLMNFRRLDPAYVSQGKVGLARGSKGEVSVRNKYVGDESALRIAAVAVRAQTEQNSAEFHLIPDPRHTPRAFDEWLRILKSGAGPEASFWQIEGSDVRFRHLRSKNHKLRTEFWMGASVSAAVQINEPEKAGSENSLSGFAMGLDGRRYLVRQADLHANKASGRIHDQEFARRTGSPVATVGTKMGRANRRWHVVACLDDPSKKVAADTADVVSRCWTARVWGNHAAADRERMEQLIGKPEQGGWHDLPPNPNSVRVLRMQGYVYEELSRILKLAGRSIQKPRHADRYEVDGVIETACDRMLLGIKTSTAAADVYCWVGQLSLYPALLTDLAKHARALLLPGRSTKSLADAVETFGIELHYYSATRSRRGAKIVFSKSFLERCGVPANILETVGTVLSD